MNEKLDINFGVMHGRSALQLAIDEHQGGATVRVSSRQAVWRGVFEALDSAGKTLSSAPVRVLEETDAIIAACLRFGSYFYTLTTGLRRQWNANDSRITDSEMRCIKIEFAASLAQWWRDRDADSEKVNRRVRAALIHLPLSWRDDRESWYRNCSDIDQSDVVHSIRRQLEHYITVIDTLTSDDIFPYDVRKEANMAVLECWRRGPVKEHHAGLASDEIGLFGVCRFSAFEVNKIMQYASTTLPMELTQHSAWDKRVQSLYLQYHPKYPDSWSVTDETADVLLAGPADIEAVSACLRRVQICCPGNFAEVNDAPTMS